jgi:hypothetical protein
MKSHEYAEKLKAAAEALLAREDVEFVGRPPFIPISFYEKEPFIAAVRVLGSGEKKWTHDELQFTPYGAMEIFRLYIARNTVCRLVRPAEYDCEPILSETEAAAL